MASCDVCNEEASSETGTRYTGKEFQKLLSKGFKPEGGTGGAGLLAIAKAGGASERQAIELWKQECARLGMFSTDWLLCPKCAARASDIMAKPAGRRWWQFWKR
jgi:hypothetical protein